jgi:hypothetical protein
MSKEPTKATFKAENRVSVEWVLSDDEPSLWSWSVPVEWKTDESSLPPDKIASNISDAIDEKHDAVTAYFYE